MDIEVIFAFVLLLLFLSFLLVDLCKISFYKEIAHEIRVIESFRTKKQYKEIGIKEIVYYIDKKGEKRKKVFN